MEESDPRRRFPRIFLVGMHDLRELTGAKVEWENGQRTYVLDMSYSGLAAVRPAGIEFEKDKQLNIKIIFAGLEPQIMQIRLVRETEKIFGAKFVNLTKENIKIMDQFLSDKLLGRNLRVVNPKFYHVKHDFDLWLHGPNNTNLYVWMSENKIKKSVFEMGGAALVYDSNNFILQKIDYLIEEDDYVIFPQKMADIKNLNDFINRALKVLSQVEDAPAAVWTLIDLLKEAK